MRSLVAASALAGVASAAATWHTITHRASGLRLQDCPPASGHRSADWLWLDTDDLPRRDECLRGWLLDPSQPGIITSMPNHCMGCFYWGEWSPASGSRCYDLGRGRFVRRHPSARTHPCTAH